VRVNRLPGWLRALMAVLVVLGLATACSSAPPEELNGRVKALTSNIEDARKANDKAKSDFPGLLKQDKFAFIASYPAEQQHSDRFGQANTKLDDAQRVYDREVKPIAGDYEDAKKAQLEAAITKTQGLIDEAKGLTAHPALWLTKVAATKADPDGTVRAATTNVSNVQTVYTPLSGDVDAAKKTYERNAGGIDTKFQPLRTQHDKALQANGLLQAEAKKSPPNYALMAEHSTTVEDNAAAFKKDAPAFKAKIAQLNVRETQTLVDIRVDSEVTITRTTWDEYYDFPDEHEHEYPSVMVDLETANHFAKFGPDDVLATDSDGWGGGFKTDKAERAQWDKLKIDPRNPKWNDGDDSAEFTGEVEDTYCHKLRVLKDGKPDASGRPTPADNYCSKYDTDGDVAQGMYWIEADELDADAIGMDIYSKGLGDFDDQATDEATPPGMVYVGDTNTGAWQTDNNGNSFWAFYGQYMFFSQLIGGPNSYHYRSEYDDWNRNYRYGHKPYYGSMNGQPRYGMKSPLAQTRFPNSTYVRSGLFNSSVRGAGPAARAGGPGGGGK
jgi:hypothetical protein